MKESVPSPVPAPVVVPTTKPATNTDTKTPDTSAFGSNDSLIVYKTNTRKKYHLDGCSSLSKSKIPITIKDAKAEGLGPCGNCHPPE